MKSLQSRVHAAVISVTLVVVVTIVVLVNSTVQRMVAAKENAHAQEALNLALMTIRVENSSYGFHRQTLLDERRQALRSIVESGVGAIAHAYDLSQKGAMTEAEAQHLALETVRRMRYAGGSGYLWIQDCALPIPTMLMHPPMPQMEGGPGTDERFFQALDGGTNLLAEFVRRTGAGPAYVLYRWPKPTPEGLTHMQPKISYVSRFAPWGWLVGTGLYIDDIERACDEHRQEMMASTMHLLKDVRLMESGYLYIFDSDGNILLHPEFSVGENVMHLINPETGDPLFQDLMDAAHKPGGRLEYTWGKPGMPAGKRFRKIAYVRYFEPLDWYLGASIYEDELHAPARGLIGKILWVSGGLLLLGVLLCWALVRSIVRPLGRLAESAQHMQTVSFDNVDSQELLVDGPEEVRVLGLRLHQLLESLRREQQHLRQSQKMEAIGALAGGVAHDFNNMLGGIMGAAELIADTLDDQDHENKEYLDLIMESAKHAADLAKQLLAFGRKQTIAFTPVSVHQIVHDTISILNKTIDKRIIIESDLSADACIVMGDYSLLQSVFLNVGINAAHAMPGGGHLVFESSLLHVEKGDATVAGLAPGPHIELTIRDTGHGISAKNLEKIFEPFFTTKGSGRGTGLGLAACYGTIKQHHGGILVDSAVGCGSSFRVILPLTDVKAADEPSSIQLHEGGGTILLVDDEAVMRVTGESLLKKYGYTVVLAANGEEAVDVYRTQHDKIDLVICDMIMPEMNGRDCFASLKSIDPKVPFVLASGFAQREDIVDLQDRGLAGHIMKPYRSVDFIQAVQRALSS